MSEEAADIIEKLRRLLDDGKQPDLTEPEVRKIRQMMAAYETLLAGGRLGRWVMGAIILLGASIAAGIKLLEYVVQAGRTP